MTYDPVRWDPLTLEDFVRYAGASGDFNPLHYDREHARAAGMPDAIAQGMLSMGLLASALETWFAPGQVAQLSVRFRAPALLGDRLHAEIERGEVLVVRLMCNDREIATGTAVVREDTDD